MHVRPHGAGGRGAAAAAPRQPGCCPWGGARSCATAFLLTAFVAAGRSGRRKQAVFREPAALRPDATHPDPFCAPRQVRTLKAEKAWLESQMRQRAADASPARPPLVRRLSA